LDYLIKICVNYKNGKIILKKDETYATDTKLLKKIKLKIWNSIVSSINETKKNNYYY